MSLTRETVRVMARKTHELQPVKAADMEDPGYFRFYHARSMLQEWIDAKVKHKECLIRAALLRFLTPQEIDLTVATRSPAILNHYGLKIEHIIPTRDGFSQEPEILRIHQHGKPALEVKLELPSAV